MGGLFSKPKAPAVPVSAPVVVPLAPVMPEPDDTKAREARKKAAAAQKKRGGRASTILSDTLG